MSETKIYIHKRITHNTSQRKNKINVLSNHLIDKFETTIGLCKGK